MENMRNIVRPGILFLQRIAPWQFLVWAVIVLVIQYIQIPYVFALQDDMWLWYGVQRLASGEIPIRDFQSYDPGRYIVTYILSFGLDTFYSLRFVQALHGAFIVGAGIWYIQRNKNAHIGVIALIGVVLFVWLFPRHKYYDIAMSVVSVLFLWYLISQQTRMSRLLAAPMVLLTLIMGRNHALFLTIAISTWMIWQQMSCTSEQRMKWAQYREFLLGVMIALLMIMSVVLFVPGYVEVYFVNAFLVYLHGQATNLPIPITWPWQIDWLAVTNIAVLHNAILSCLLFLIPCIAIVALVWEARITRRTGIVRTYLLAPALLILPYMYHAYSRAGVSHLAQSIYPLIIYVAAFSVHTLQYSTIKNRYRRMLWFMLAGLVAVSAVLMYPQQPIVRCDNRCVPVTIDNQVFYTDTGTRDDYLLLQGWLEKYATTKSFVVYSIRPGLYAINHVGAPVYDTYTIFVKSDDDQLQEIQDIEDAQVHMIIISKIGADGTPKTAFRNTNPLTFAHVQKHYTVVEYTKYYEAYLRNPE